MSLQLKIGLIIFDFVTVVAQAEEDCSQIDDPTLSLACFDGKFPKNSPRAATKATRESKPAPGETIQESRQVIAEQGIEAEALISAPRLVDI